MSIMGWYAQGLLGTILIECLMALALGIRGWRNVARVAVIQAMTNPLVLSVVSLALRYCDVGSMPYLVVVATMEASVMFIEAGLITALIPSGDVARTRAHNALLMSVALNATSFFVGSPLLGLLRSVLGSLM